MAESMQNDSDTLLIGLISISDRASAGVYRDEGIPALQDWFGKAIAGPTWRVETRLIPDEQPLIETAIIELVDHAGCHLVLTTGGTGPAKRDVTPGHARGRTQTHAGFGEQMRTTSLEFVPTSILSRQVAVIRYRIAAGAPAAGCLSTNLPGHPKSIRETLEGLKDKDGKQLVAGIFAAVPYCIDLIGGPYIETHAEVIKAFRPKSALRPKKDQAP